MERPFIYAIFLSFVKVKANNLGAYMLSFATFQFITETSFWIKNH